MSTKTFSWSCILGMSHLMVETVKITEYLSKKRIWYSQYMVNQLIQDIFRISENFFGFQKTFSDFGKSFSDFGILDFGSFFGLRKICFGLRNANFSIKHYKTCRYTCRWNTWNSLTSIVKYKRTKLGMKHKTHTFYNAF